MQAISPAGQVAAWQLMAVSPRHFEFQMRVRYHAALTRRLDTGGFSTFRFVTISRCLGKLAGAAIWRDKMGEYEYVVRSVTKVRHATTRVRNDADIGRKCCRGFATTSHIVERGYDHAMPYMMIIDSPLPHILPIFQNMMRADYDAPTSILPQYTPPARHDAIGRLGYIVLPRIMPCY